MGASGNRRSIKLSNLSGSAPVDEKPVDNKNASLNDDFTEADPTFEAAAVTGEPVVDSPEAAPAEQMSESEEMAAAFAAAFNGEPVPAEAEEPAPAVEDVAEEVAEETPAPAEEPAPAVEAEPTADSTLDEIVEKSATLADALAEIEHRREEKEKEEDELLSTMVSDEVGFIAKGTKIHGDIVADGHLEINGVVEGGIIARGNVKVNGDVFGDISCGNLIINEGVLKVDVQAREDISLGASARIEGDIRCRRISVEGTVVGNITATELVQVAESATVTGNLTTGGIAIGMGATVNGSIKMVK